MRDWRASVAIWRFIKQTARWSVRADTVVGASKYFLLIWGAILLVCAALLGLLYVVLTSFATTAGWLNTLIAAAAVLLLIAACGLLALGWKDREAALAIQKAESASDSPLPIATQTAPKVEEPAERHSISLAAVARQLVTELRDIQNKIELVRGTGPVNHYGSVFQLPAARWDQYDEVLAEHPELYAIVEKAYVAAHRSNEVVALRRSRASPGQTLGVIEEDGLVEAYEAAEEAIDALVAVTTTPGSSPAASVPERAARKPRADAPVPRAQHQVFANHVVLTIQGDPFGYEEVRCTVVDPDGTRTEAITKPKSVPGPFPTFSMLARPVATLHYPTEFDGASELYEGVYHVTWKLPHSMFSMFGGVINDVFRV